MSDAGASGRQTWEPSAFSGTSTPVTPRGRTVTVPRMRVPCGVAPSSRSTWSAPSSQRSPDGPMRIAASDWRRAARPRSVIVQRPPGPDISTLTQTWSSGSPRPDHPYQGEKTEPMKAITEMAREPSAETPSQYHQP